MLNTEHIGDSIHCTTDAGELVATIRYTTQGLWLVVATEAYMHGTSTMWWRSLKAAEYHVLAIYEDATAAKGA
jgi:hypothetical protein